MKIAETLLHTSILYTITPLDLNLHQKLYNKCKSAIGVLPKLFQDKKYYRQKKDKLIGVRNRAIDKNSENLKYYMHATSQSFVKV